MKRKMIIRFLSLMLAGVLMSGSPMQAFASELNNGALDGEEQLDTEEELMKSEQLESPAESEQTDQKMPKESQLPDSEKESAENQYPETPVESEQPGESEEPAGEIPGEEEVAAPEVQTEVARIELSSDSLVMELGETKELTVTAYDSGGAEVDTSFFWKVGDSSIIDVSGSGTLNALKTGTTTVNVSTANGMSASCEVKVIISVKLVTLDKHTLELKKGQSVVLAAAIAPENTTESRTLTWTSGNPDIASVDSTGKVTGKTSGNTTVTVTSENGVKDVCNITVLDQELVTGWKTENGKTYYYDAQGVAVTGWQIIGGAKYYFNSDGSMKTGWYKENGKWYCLTGNGAVVGWRTIVKAKYYFNSDGTMKTGWHSDAGKWYYFGNNGAVTGWQIIGGAKYYFNSDGTMKTGWYKENGKWYCLTGNGAAVGWKTIVKAKYYFNSDGTMKTGWYKEAGKWYYLSDNGAVVGWKTIGSGKYYFNSDGTMKTGWYYESGTWYYFYENGAAKGWKSINNEWYFFNNDGTMKTRWYKEGSKWYYFGTNGVMRKGWQKDGNTWYYMNSSGVMQTGWQKVSENWYYLGTNGAMRTGWQKIDGTWYYFLSSGAMKTGWLQLSGKWYYLGTNGAMKIGWLEVDGKKYYLNSNGVMVTSDTTIDGVTHKFASNGEWKGAKETKIYGIDVSSNQGSINWKKVADDGIDFAMLRVVTGKISNMERDTRFKEYYDGARDAGIKVGAYRYSYATSRTEARKEAEAVIKALNGRKLDYPVVLDMEASSILDNTESNSRRSDIILAFKEEIEDAGYKFALYANTTWLNSYLDMNKLKNVDIWVARWRNLDSGHGYTGKGNVIMWQYSNSGKVSGISGKVDLDVSYKNY